MNRVITSLFLLLSLTGYSQTIMRIHQSNGMVLQLPLNTIDSITYSIRIPGNLATLTTLTVQSITGSTALSGGNITNNGGSPVTERGVFWSTSPNLSTAINSTKDDSGSGTFSSYITGLKASTTYYVRAYATNSDGTAYGNELSFTTTTSDDGSMFAKGAGVTDVNGHTYSSIVLDNGQEWMSENLKTSTYSNGDSIPNTTSTLSWNNLTTGAWLYYNNDSKYDSIYGKLYNWYAAIDTRNLCPSGWHVPTEEDWQLLKNYAVAPAGGKLKSTGNIQALTGLWEAPNVSATNITGFSGLPGGVAMNPDEFQSIGFKGVWQSAGDPWQVSTIVLENNYDGMNGGSTGYRSYTMGKSVRCIKN